MKNTSKHVRKTVVAALLAITSTLVIAGSGDPPAPNPSGKQTSSRNPHPWNDVLDSCLHAQYDSSGNTQDNSWCSEHSLCSGNCFRSSVTGDTSGCRHCQDPVPQVPSPQCNLNTATSIDGDRWSTKCKTAGSSYCGCEDNWVYNGFDMVWCYKATGDVCLE
jgi:hypothetical protein